jgi:flavin reductase (DIM6/NTAB) family NADH-FMN oxidoreductase RutF
MPVDAAEFAAALRQHATGVCLLTVRDDMDDVGVTVSAVMSVSAEPPLVAVGLTSGGYPAEMLAAVGRCALTVLAEGHAIVASRFASSGRPSARHLLESVPWRRAEYSSAIVLEHALAALDCRLTTMVEAGDHVLALLEVQQVPALDERAAPLIRHRGRYLGESGG